MMSHLQPTSREHPTKDDDISMSKAKAVCKAIAIASKAILKQQKIKMLSSRITRLRKVKGLRGRQQLHQRKKTK